MAAKILGFTLFETLQYGVFRTFCSPELSLKNWILHCVRENFPEYPPDITIQISTIVYLIPQLFSWLKSYKVLIPKFFPGGSFASTKTIRALLDMNPLLMMKMVAKSNART